MKAKNNKARLRISTANAANDDWLQQSHPDVYEVEQRIHNLLAVIYAQQLLTKKHKA